MLYFKGEIGIVWYKEKWKVFTRPFTGLFALKYE